MTQSMLFSVYLYIKNKNNVIQVKWICKHFEIREHFACRNCCSGFCSKMSMIVLQRDAQSLSMGILLVWYVNTLGIQKHKRVFFVTVKWWTFFKHYFCCYVLMKLSHCDGSLMGKDRQEKHWSARWHSIVTFEFQTISACFTSSWWSL